MVFLDIGGHFIAAGVFGSAGYYFHGLKERQRMSLIDRMNLLT